MTRQQHPTPSYQGVRKVVRSLTAAVILIALVAGLPYAMIVIAGSPIPHHWPSWDEIISALSQRDDGTLLLGVLRFLAWLLWVFWVGLLLVEAIARLLGRITPRIPGLEVPQSLAALLISSLGAAVIGTSVSLSRASTLPPPPSSGVAGTAAPGHTTSATSETIAPATQRQADQVSAEDTDQNRPAPTAGHVAPTVHGQPGAPDYHEAAARSGQQTVTIRFAFDSASLTAEAKAALARAARNISDGADPSRPVRIVGHTDSLGPTSYNHRLSLRRADTVQKVLSSALGSTFRLEIEGRGETDPIARETCGAPENPIAHVRNRRVEITYAVRSASSTTSPTGRPPNQRTNGGTVGSGSAPSSGPTSSAATSSPGPSPTSSEPAEHPPSPSPSPGQEPVTIELPSGAVVGLSFAAGIGTALVASRLHRRRRHRTPRTGPTPDTDEPGPAPVVRTLRRADLEARQAGRSDPASPVDADDRLHLFPLPSNGKITLGVREGQEVTVPIGGLVAGLTGPGAQGCARALLLTLLAHAGDHDIEIIIPRSDVARLLSLSDEQVEQTAEHLQALVMVGDLDTGLRLLESERIHRARLLEAPDGHDSLAALRQADPTEPVPRLVLAATPGEEQRLRLQAVCAFADDYDIAVILLGEHPAGPTVRLDDDAQVLETLGGDGSQDRRWEGLRLFHIAADDTRQLLDVILSGQGAPQQESSPSSDRRVAPPAPVPAPARPQQQAPARLRVLGPPTLTVDGNEIATGIRGKARELLTYLADSPDGAPRDVILEALWPQVDQRHAVMRFHSSINDVRRELRRATSLTHEDFVALAADRYRLDSDLVSVDLWDFRTALQQAAQIDDPHQRADHLQQATEFYAGSLAAEHSYEWIEPQREALRRQAVETFVHLADLREDDEPERALATLEDALSVDRYAEEIYQRIMILQARLGRRDAVRRTHRLLETSLEDLGVDPSDETQQLLWRLLNPGGRSSTRPRAR